MNDRTDDLILCAGELPYTELDYTVFCASHDEPQALRAYFGAVKFEHMERRYQAEHCEVCESELEPWEVSEEITQCQDCRHIPDWSRDNPDADNDTPRSEMED